MGLRVKPAAKWPDGTIPYKYSDQSKIASEHRVIVEKVMARWEGLIGGGLVRFIPAQDEHKRYLLLKDGGTGSMVDFIGMPADKTVATLAVGTGGLMNVLPHELGHVMGLAHENERNLRFYSDPKENPKTVVYDQNVGPRLYFLKDMIGELRLPTVIKKFNKEYDTCGAYDLFSIMHYSAVKGFSFDCDNKTLAEYCDSKGWPGLNQPSNDDVAEDTWRASPTDLQTLRELYRQEETQS